MHLVSLNPESRSCERGFKLGNNSLLPALVPDVKTLALGTVALAAHRKIEECLSRNVSPKQNSEASLANSSERGHALH